jgi:glycosyltransferase involved in cell wall biosynthesis
VDFTVVPRLARLLRRLRADIVHSYLFSAEIAARLAGRFAGTPVIIGSERTTNYRLKKRNLWAYRLTRGCVDLIIANSNAGAAFNSRLLGHSPSLYRVVHNGVDTARFTAQDPRPIRHELGLEQDESVVGMFASFKPQKNHALLFAAFQRVAASWPRTRLLLVGDELVGGAHGADEYKSRMQALVDELGIRRHCLLLGNRGDVERLYPACDVTILSSLCEGTPNVLLESMACGVPVVATDVSDNRYVAPDGEVGYIVPLDDAAAMADRICRLLANKDLRQQLGKQARRWTEREFSIGQLAKKTEAVYLEALASHSACAPSG